MVIHLLIRNMVGMIETAKMRRIGKVRERRHRTVIVKGIDNKALHRMGRDCQMGISFPKIF